MDDTRFTAGNGWWVEGVVLRHPGGAPEMNVLSSPAQALMEYGARNAQAERDAELGRWRSVAHPDWVVYLASDAGDIDDANYRECVVIDERNGERWRYGSDITVCHSGEGKEVAREFFAAHPVPELKPWHDAEEGEVWVLTAPRTEFAALYLSGAFRHAGSGVELILTNVIAGRRIWPEMTP
jgi:hypothetical protein